LITYVIGVSEFQCTYEDFNPGNSIVFTWLANIAQNYSQWNLLKARMYYVPRVSSSTSGSFLMAVDPQSGSSTTPQFETEMSNYQVAVDGAAWETFDLELDPKSMMGGMTRKYVRTTGETDIQEDNTVNGGKILLATTGSTTGNTLWGKVYMSYDVEFFSPVVNGSPSGSPGCSYALSGVTSANEFGNATVPAFSPNPPAITIQTGGVILFNAPGVYAISYCVNAGTSCTFGAQLFSGCTQSNQWNGGTGTDFSGNATAGYNQTLILEVPNANSSAPATWTLGLTIVGTTTGNLLITSMPYGYTSRGGWVGRYPTLLNSKDEVREDPGDDSQPVDQPVLRHIDTDAFGPKSLKR
jgi:uncharacterized protein YndB with AHSA1/START domain